MSGPQRFRKKPVVIEAWRLSEDSLEAVAEWCGGVAREELPRAAGLSWLIISTLEGDMHAEAGDWIIRGVQGEFYPCKPDIFDATYEAAVSSSAAVRVTVDELAAKVAETLSTYVPDGFRDEDGVWHEGPRLRDNLAALTELVALARQAAAWKAIRDRDVALADNDRDRWREHESKVAIEPTSAIQADRIASCPTCGGGSE